MKNPFYVYALKDPRNKPAKIFYIGKGTGNRMENHLQDKTETIKTKTIKEIIQSGNTVLIEKLVDDLTELQALKIESELIAAFGVKTRGGILANTVRPSGLKQTESALNVPDGCYEKVQIGLDMMASGILEFIKANKNGVTNGDVTKYLGIHSEYQGGSINYLSYSILGLLLKDNKIEKDGRLHKILKSAQQGDAP